MLRVGTLRFFCHNPSSYWDSCRQHFWLFYSPIPDRITLMNTHYFFIILLVCFRNGWCPACYWGERSFMITWGPVLLPTLPHCTMMFSGATVHQVPKPALNYQPVLKGVYSNTRMLFMDLGRWAKQPASRFILTARPVWRIHPVSITVLLLYFEIELPIPAGDIQLLIKPVAGNISNTSDNVGATIQPKFREPMYCPWLADNSPRAFSNRHLRSVTTNLLRLISVLQTPDGDSLYLYRFRMCISMAVPLAKCELYLRTVPGPAMFLSIPLLIHLYSGTSPLRKPWLTSKPANRYHMSGKP